MWRNINVSKIIDMEVVNVNSTLLCMGDASHKCLAIKQVTSVIASVIIPSLASLFLSQS